MLFEPKMALNLAAGYLYTHGIFFKFANLPLEKLQSVTAPLEQKKEGRNPLIISFGFILAFSFALLSFAFLLLTLRHPYPP